MNYLQEMSNKFFFFLPLPYGNPPPQAPKSPTLLHSIQIVLPVVVEVSAVLVEGHPTCHTVEYSVLSESVSIPADTATSGWSALCGWGEPLQMVI